MAAVLVMRLLVWAAAGATAVKITQGAPGQTFGWFNWLAVLLDDESKTDEEKSAEASSYTGMLVEVATYPGPFSLRKLHMVYGRASGSALPDDDAINTFHFLKLTGAAPDDVWVDADFVAVETAWDTVWNYLKPRYHTSYRLKQYRWYQSGPDVEAEQNGQGRTGPPVRVVDRNLIGGTANGVQLPPQTALTVTERTSEPRSWGRFYMPAPMATDHAWDNLDQSGRWSVAWIQNVADAWETAYNAVQAAGTPVVVYSQAKAERPSARGGTLPAVGARAFTVNEIQVDDLADVIRSRRWSSPLVRERRTI